VRVENADGILIVPSRRRSAARQIAGFFLRRRWVILLPAAIGLASLSAINGAVAERAVAGAIGGLVLGLALAAWREQRNGGLASEESVSRVLMLPVLGSVSVLAPEGEWRWQRRRRNALDVAGFVVVMLALVSAFWRLLFR
jgi:hypothetical protein